MSQPPDLEIIAMNAHLKSVEFNQDSGKINKSIQAALEECIEEEMNAPRNLGCPRLSRSGRILLINDLHSYYLEAIFAHIPMQELLSRYRLVCARWCHEIEAMCRRQKKSLALFDRIYNGLKYDIDCSQEMLKYIGNKLFSDINPNNFIIISLPFYFLTLAPLYIHVIEGYNYLPDELCQFLLRLFPSPSELFISCYDITTSGSIYDTYRQFLPLVAPLLNQWSPHLKTFSYSSTLTVNSPLMYQLLTEFLNSCTQLKCLHLNPDNLRRHDFLELLAPTFKRIDRFAFYLFDRQNFDWFPFAAQIGFNCTHLYVRPSSYDDLDQRHLRQWCMDNPTFISNLTHFRFAFNINRVDTSLTQFLSRHFTSLKVLKLDKLLGNTLFGVNDVEIPLINPLASMVNLEELHLHLIDSALNIKLFHNYRPLWKIRKLSIIYARATVSPLNTKNLKRHFFFTISKLFPNLEELIIAERYARIANMNFVKFLRRFPKLLKFEYSGVLEELQFKFLNDPK